MALLRLSPVPLGYRATYYIIRTFGYLQNKVLSTETLSQTLDLENFNMQYVILSQSVVNLV